MNHLRSIVLFALIVPTMMFAQEPPASYSGTVDVHQYVQHLRALRADFESGEPRALSTREWRLFDDASRTVHRILDGREDVASLTKRQEANLFSAQETIQSIVNNSEGDRLICRREATTGSRLRSTSCLTASQRARQREASQEMYRDRSVTQTIQPADPDPGATSFRRAPR